MGPDDEPRMSSMSGAGSSPTSCLNTCVKLLPGPRDLTRGIALSRTTPRTLFLAPMTHYLVSSLCSFYRTRLNPTTRAQLSGNGPRESLAAYIEWVLVSSRSSWTTEDDTSPSPDPEPSQPSPRFAEHVQPSARAGHRARDAPEQDLTDFFGEVDEDMPALLPPSSKLPDCLDFPPTLPLFSPSIVAAASVPPPLPPGSPSPHPQPTICAVGSLQVCQSPSVSWLEDSSSLPPASESRTPLGPPTQWLHPGSQLPRLHRRPSAHQLPWAPSSLRLHLGRLLSRHRLRTLLLPLRLIAPSHQLRWAPLSLQLHLSPLSLQLRRGPPEHRLRLGRQSLGLRLGPPDPLCRPGSSVSASGSTSTCSASVSRPPGVVSPSSTMAPPSVSSTMGYHNGCGLGLTWLLLLRVPSVSSLAPPSVVSTMDFVVLLPGVRPPPKPPPTMIFCCHPTSTPLFLFFPWCEVAPSGRGE
ncbi:Nucleolar protein 9 [Labeo rohita]|uniref:Nucleolar protein 9 n=1 Tax=Labeo rohita TaxID=84645 RepID=A0ABQ8L4V6_LABRO|nr:Nucleolar protein 9 [Labeo rohita]